MSFDVKDLLYTFWDVQGTSYPSSKDKMYDSSMLYQQLKKMGKGRG